MERITTNGISLFESMQYIRGAAANKFAAFKEIIDTLRVAKDEMPLPAFVDFTVEKSGLKNMYEMDPNGSERIENLQELTSLKKKRSIRKIPTALRLRIFLL